MKRQALKYGLVGILGTFLHFASLFILVETFRVQPALSSALGFILVLITSYILNKFWTFQASTPGWKPLLKYITVSIIGLLLNTAIVYTTVYLLHWHYLIGQCLVVAAVPLTNFILNYYWTFQVKNEPL
jgi:putative flippase GtrA